MGGRRFSWTWPLSLVLGPVSEEKPASLSELGPCTTAPSRLGSPVLSSPELSTVTSPQHPWLGGADRYVVYCLHCIGDVACPHPPHTCNGASAGHVLPSSLP